MNKPKLHVVSFSGGKDSTAMLLRMIEENYPVDVILYARMNGLEFPEMEVHIKKVEQYIGRKITIVESEKDFIYYATEHKRIVKSDKIPGINPGDMVHGYGYPTPFSRWCTSKLKLAPIEKYLKSLEKNYNVIQYVGIAYDERHRERDKTYPLINWKMTEAECLKYCKDRGFDWGGLYEIFDRVSCWCCPLQSLDNLRKLKTSRPTLWEKLIEMDNKISKTTRPNFQHSKSLTDIERRFEVEDEFIKQGKKLRTKEFFNELKARGINY